MWMRQCDTRYAKSRNSCIDLVMIDSLQKQELGKFNGGSDIGEMWLSWSEKFQRVLDLHAPAVVQRRCNKKPHRMCPWATSQLGHINYQKLLGHRPLWKSPSEPDLRQKFCTLRKECSKLSRRPKNKYFYDECSTRAHQPKNRGSWSTLSRDGSRYTAHLAQSLRIWARLSQLWWLIYLVQQD